METLQKRLDALEQQTEQLKRHLRRWRRLAYALGALGCVALPLVSVKAQVGATLEQRVEQLEYKLAHVTSGPDDITISGANLQIVNGLGATNTVNGLGNLIVGYQEQRLPPSPNIRTGSHNVIVGRQHNYSSFGGLVVAQFNEISGPWASVTGGTRNTASGLNASVSGGMFNRATFPEASVSGGLNNTASGMGSSVSGGVSNTASGIVFDEPWGSSVSGGVGNVASQQFSSISGEGNNTASGNGASVSGGAFNVASGFRASVSGGSNNTASSTVFPNAPSVSGGFNNTASGQYASVSGGENNTASGDFSSVSGGTNRNAPGTENWAAGPLFADH